MRNLALACVLLALGVAAQEEAAKDTVIIEPKTAKRMLPADVLRDFPGMCFGSTTCQAYPVGGTWPLIPFCGQATCVKNATGYFEQVEDCGPIPKPNPKCRQVEVVLDPNRPPPPFPVCCPTYECARGVTLEYPTEAEIKAEIERAREQQEAHQRALLEQQGAAAQPAAQA